MTVRSRWLIALLCLLAGPAAAQDHPPEYWENYKPSNVFQEKNSIRPPRSAGGGGNAAIAYFEAWDMLPRKEFMRFNELCADLPEPDKKLSADLRAALLQHSGYIDALLRAAATEHCDWGMDWDAGWELLLPHLGWARSSCRALTADARRCMEDNSPLAAIERIQAIIRIGQHASEGPILISSLVGIAITHRAAQVTGEFLDAHALTPAHARILLKAFRAIPREDLCNTIAAISKEREVTIAWLREQCRSAEPGADYARLMKSMGMGITGADRFILSMSRDRFENDIGRADRLFQLIEKAWACDDPLPRLEELADEIDEFQHGLLAFNMVPAFTKARATVNRLETTLTTLERRLQALAAPDAPQPAGPSTPQQSQEVAPTNTAPKH